MMLFLGAGASKRFGIKTMQEMSREFENNVDSLLNAGEKGLYKDIRNALDSNNLEDILSVLNDLSEEAQNPTVIYLKSLLQKFRKSKLVGNVDAVVDLISNTTVDTNLSRKLQSKIIHYIERYYDLLTDEYYLFSKKYDYGEKRDISYTDGFLYKAFTGLIIGTINPDVWDSKKLDEIMKYAQGNVPLIRMFKLHGSIDQYYQNEEIVKKNILFPTKTVAGVELKDSMLYPMREKEVYKDPFFELLTRLKTSLLSEKICLVIGYSFRDEHIRNIFFDAVKRNPEIRIFLGNKKPDKVIGNLEQIKQNITPIKGEFGEEDFFERLREEFEECKTLIS
ncbi:MAG: SIR2 family protein [archaeon]|nr:SIR2 family protein [archaeon]